MMSDSAQSESVLDRIALRTRRLCSLPAVAARVLELAGRDQVDPRAIKDCIENDPALTAKLLRVANSSLFGFRGEVSNLNQAIGLFGIRTLKMLVLGFSLPSQLTRDVPPALLARFWRHTVYRAVAARTLAKKHWHTPGDDAFLAGLLSGVGMLALIQDLGASYTHFLEHLFEHGGDVAEQELEVLGFDHAVLSARMLRQWELPEALVAAVARPRQTARILALEPAEQPLAAILNIADLASDFLLSGKAARLQQLLAAARELKGLTPMQVRTLLSEIEQEVGPLTDLFQIPPPETGSFQQIFEVAHATLVQVTEEALTADDDLDPQLTALLDEARSLREELSQALRQPDPNSPRSSRRPDGPWPDSPRPRPAAISSARESAQLSQRLASVIEDCRQHRSAMSLAFVAVDQYADVAIAAGIEAAQRFVRWLQRLCVSLCDDPRRVIAAGDARFALLLDGYDRRAAVALARELVDAVRKHAGSHASSAGRGIKVSVGVATLSVPPRNFSEDELIQAARRCQQGSSASGGNTVKSIEL
jgi:HD-like signal output (HDOD) protein/GGDEF domain-containing protein